MGLGLELFGPGRRTTPYLKSYQGRSSILIILVPSYSWLVVVDWMWIILMWGKDLFTGFEVCWSCPVNWGLIILIGIQTKNPGKREAHQLVGLKGFGGNFWRKGFLREGFGQKVGHFFPQAIGFFKGIGKKAG